MRIDKKGIDVTLKFVNRSDNSLLFNDPIVKNWYKKAKSGERYIQGSPIQKMYRRVKALFGQVKSTYLDASGNPVNQAEEHTYIMTQNLNGKPGYIQKTSQDGDAIVIKILDKSGVERHITHGPEVDEIVTKNPETGKIIEMSQKSHDFKADLQ